MKLVRERVDHFGHEVLGVGGRGKEPVELGLVGQEHHGLQQQKEVEVRCEREHLKCRERGAR